MTDQNKYTDQTRTVVSDLVVSTNELTTYVISLLDSVSVDVDSLIAQLKDATDKIDEGVADLEQIRDKTLQDIHQAQDDISGVYEVFMQESQKLRNDLAGMYTQADDLDRRLDTLEGAQRDLETLYTNLGVLAKSIEADINTSNIKVRDIQARIAQAESDITGLRAQLTSLATDLQTSQLAVADFESRMSVLEQKVTAAASDIHYISDQIAKCVTDINTINQRIGTADQQSRDALELANTAYATVNSLTIDVGVLSTKLDQITNTYNQLNASVADANATVSKVNGDVANLVNNVNNTSTELTNRLAAMESDLQNAGIKLDQANSLLTQLETSIATLNVDYQSLNVEIKNQITDATNAAKAANVSAESLATQISALTVQMIDYTSQADLANQNIQHLQDDLVTAQVDLDGKINSTNQTLAEVKAEALDLNSDTRGLRNEVQVLALDVNSKAVQVTALAQHVDEQKEYVDQRVAEIDSEYLRKLERAADTALFMGHDIGYFAHNGNFEAKLDASVGIATMRGETAALKSLMSVDNENLNSLQEIVDFIEQNRADLDNLGISNIAGLQAALDGKLGITAKAVDSTLFDGKALGYFVHDGNFNTKLDTMAVIATIRTDITARSLTTHNHDGRYFRADADSSGAGNITITSASSRSLNVQGNGSTIKGSVNAYSNGTGAGEMYVGKSNAIGGGMVFGGVADASTAGLALANGGINNLILFRQTAAGVREWTARNANTGNDWEFRGSLIAQTIFDGANRVFSAGYLPDWSQVTNKPAYATRWSDWTEVTGKPSTFAPSAHTHLWADLTDKPTTFAPSAHTHLWADITDKPSTFTPSAHNHYNVISQGRIAAWAGAVDPTYGGVSMVQAFNNGYPYTYGNVLTMSGDGSSQIQVSDDAKLAIRSKSAGGSWTAWTEVYTKLNGVDWADLLNKPATFEPSTHSHSWAQITGVPDATLAQKGIVQLDSSTSSNVNTTAATSAAVKVAFDLAAGKVGKTSDTMSGTLTALNVLISGSQGTAANAVVRKDYADTKVTKDLSQYFAGHFLTKTADYNTDSLARDLTYSGFYRPNGMVLDTLALPSLMLHVAHATTGKQHARGIGFDYGGTGWGAYVTRFDAAGAYLGKGKIYTEYDKPSADDVGAVPTTRTVAGKALSTDITLAAADVGLGSVNNWGATSAVNDASNVKYSTAGAVKTAYDLAAAALPKSGGALAGPVTSSSTITATGVITGSTIKSSTAGNGLSTATQADGSWASVSAETGWVMLWKRNPATKADEFIGIDSGSNLRFRKDNGLGDKTYTDYQVFHKGFLPTAADVGALSLATGGTVAGPINMTGSLVAIGQFALQMNNQNIGGVNGITFNDPTDSTPEGLWFPKTGKSGSSTTVADFDQVYALDGKLYINSATVYDTVNKPTATDVGLGSVNNWTYSNSYTGGSASKYATEKAVTDAYSALNTAKASKGGDTFGAQMVFTNGANSMGTAGDLTKAWVLVGTTTTGIGFDPDEIYSKGTDMILGVDSAKAIKMNVGGVTKATVNSTGLSTDAVTLTGGVTMKYNTTTSCLEITFA